MQSPTVSYEYPVVDEPIEETSVGVTTIQGEPALLTVVTKGGKVIRRVATRIDNAETLRAEVYHKLQMYFPGVFLS